MLHTSKKRRSITARFLVGGFLLCALTPPLFFIALGYLVRFARIDSPSALRLYDTPARIAELSMDGGVSPDLVDRINLAIAHPGTKWSDMWVVDAQGRALSSNSQDSVPVPPSQYTRYQEQRPFVLWDNDWFSFYTHVVRPLRGDGQYWMVFRWAYFGSSMEAAITIAMLLIFSVSAAVSLLALGVIYFYFRVEGRKVRQVLADLKAGDLDARFSVDKVDEVGSLMLTFNEMADEISSLVKKVQAGEKERTELLQYLAHDIRTPLTSLRLVSEELVEDASLKPLARKRAGKLLLQELGFFERLTEDLFFLAQINQAPTAAQEPFSLERLIREESDRIQQLAKTKRKFVLALEDGISIGAREALFRRLIRNLFENATKYAQKEIKVTLAQSPAGITLRVEDDGEGFSAESLESFGKRRPLRYSVGAEKDASVSLGLGSVIVTEIVQSHGGSLTVSNRPAGSGGQVEIQLPATLVGPSLKKAA